MSARFHRLFLHAAGSVRRNLQPTDYCLHQKRGRLPGSWLVKISRLYN